MSTKYICRWLKLEHEQKIITKKAGTPHIVDFAFIIISPLEINKGMAITEVASNFIIWLLALIIALADVLRRWQRKKSRQLLEVESCPDNSLKIDR